MVPRFAVFFCFVAAVVSGEIRLGDVDALTPIGDVVRHGLTTPVENVFVGKDVGAGSTGLTNVVVVGRDSGRGATGLANVFALGDNTLRGDSSLKNCLFVGDGIGSDEMRGVTNCLMVMGRDGAYGELDAGTSGLVRFFGTFDAWETGLWHIGRNAAWLQGVPGGDVDSATLQFGIDNGGSLRYDVSTNMPTLRVGYGASVGDNGLAAGYKAAAVESGVSAGYMARGDAVGDVAIGVSAHACGEAENSKGVGAVAVGGHATAISGPDNYGGSVAVGYGAAAGDECLAVGSGAAAGSIEFKSNTNRYATAIGSGTVAGHPGSTVVGSYWSDEIGTQPVVAQGPLTFNIAAPDPTYFYFGAASHDADGDGITPRSLGWYLRWAGTFDIVMGPDAVAAANSVVIGGEAGTSGTASVAVGSWSYSDGEYSVSIGASAGCVSTKGGAGYGTAVGFGAEAYGSNATALGASTHAEVGGAAVGAGAKAYGSNATALGASAYAGIADTLAFPTDAEHTYFNSVVSNKGATAVSLQSYLDERAPRYAFGVTRSSATSVTAADGNIYALIGDTNGFSVTLPVAASYVQDFVIRLEPADTNGTRIAAIDPASTDSTSWKYDYPCGTNAVWGVITEATYFTFTQVTTNRWSIGCFPATKQEK